MPHACPPALSGPGSGDRAPAAQPSAPEATGEGSKGRQPGGQDSGLQRQRERRLEGLGSSGEGSIPQPGGGTGTGLSPVGRRQP